MQLKSLHKFFENALLGYYPKEEISSFFYRLCEAYLKLKRIDVSLKSETLVTPQTYEYFEGVISRLLKYEPIQYIIGSTSFFGLDFKVDKNVLIPRPETEELVAWVLKQANSKQPLKILDVGTGSGCIAISLAKQLPNAEVYAMDVSSGVLAIALQNAQNNEVHINFIEASILEWENQDISFDIIVSNPPYVREGEKEFILPNVLNHEPHLALFVDDHSPLLFYKAIVAMSQLNLVNGGFVYFEINENLAEETKSIFSFDAFEAIQLKKDIFSKNRMIRAKMR